MRPDEENKTLPKIGGKSGLRSWKILPGMMMRATMKRRAGGLNGCNSVGNASELMINRRLKLPKSKMIGSTTPCSGSVRNTDS
jgi:hypothetical protein